VTVACPTGRICAGGECVHDVCHNIACPVNQRCLAGECVYEWAPGPGQVLPGEGEGEGEGEEPEEEDDGCDCTIGGGSRQALPVLLVLLGLFLVRRRR